MNWAYADNALIRIPVRCPANGYYMRWYYNGWHYWFFLPGLHVIDTEGERYRTLSKRLITVSSGQVTRGQAAGIRTIMNTREVYLWTDGGWAAIRIEPGSLKIYQSDVAGTEMELTAIIGSREVTRTTGFSPVIPTPEVIPTYPWCEQVIGNQVWMCLNYDVMFPGSTVYDNNIFNLDDFGRLYSYAQITTPGFCPTGWRVPTLADWEELFAFVGAGEADKLKTAGTDYWSVGNGGTNAFGFQMRSTGRYRQGVSYQYLMERAYLWALDSVAQNRVVVFDYNSADISYATHYPTLWYGVRLIKDSLPNFIDVIYGYLYNWYAVNDPRGITADGWHIITEAERDAFITFLGGAATGGGKLKETGTVYWNAPNTGAANDYGFNARGSGYREDSTGTFTSLMDWCLYWTATSYGTTWARFFGCNYNSDDIRDDQTFAGIDKRTGLSLRPVKDSTTLAEGETGVYQGNDNRVYPTICINGIEVVSQNICETLYNDGSPITEVTGAAAWAALATGARCSYDNNESNAHA